jgi:hypothetical protein
MLSRKLSAAPGPRVFTVESTARALHREIARHNRQVALIALFTLTVAAGLWIVLYAVCAWVLMLAFICAGVSRDTLPHGFTLLFLVTAACAVGYAWIDRRFTPNDLARDDKSSGEIISDFLLALPRITLAVPGTLSAALSLKASECAKAAVFLHRLAEERRIPLHNVPFDIPDPQARFRILFALQLLEVIDLRRRDRDWSLSLNAERTRALQIPTG